MIRTAAQLLLLIFLALSFDGRATPSQFPQWRGKQLELPGLWEATPIVAVGEVRNISVFGEEVVQRLPPPMAPYVRKLYWCVADFQAKAVVKGKLPIGKKYLWASGIPGCPLFYGDRPSYERRITRVWFLREEGDYLRPTFDGGSPYSFGLLAEWSDHPFLQAKTKLGAMLLTPTAVANDLTEFADSLWNFADVACLLLGKNECIQRIIDLANLGNSTLSAAVCEYLKAQQGVPCNWP